MLGEADGWYRVRGMSIEREEITGYVAAKFVKLGELPAATQEPEATLEPTATPEELEGYDAIIKAQEEDAFVNVYAEPAVESEVLAQLMSASAIKVLSVEGDFARISIGDLIGYVEAGFLGNNETGAERSAYIVMDIPQDFRLGDSVTLRCILGGYEEASYTLQWQFAATDWNGNITGHWQDQPEANADEYTVVLTESNLLTAWRVRIDVAEELK